MMNREQKGSGVPVGATPRGCPDTGQAQGPARAWHIDRPGCTLWPEGVWHHCCVAHDYAYADHAGEPLRVKRRIDGALRVCVAGSGHPGMAWLMFCGVSVFGLIPWYRYAAARG